MPRTRYLPYFFWYTIVGATISYGALSYLSLPLTPLALALTLLSIFLLPLTLNHTNHRYLPRTPTGLHVQTAASAPNTPTPPHRTDATVLLPRPDKYAAIYYLAGLFATGVLYLGLYA